MPKVGAGKFVVYEIVEPGGEDGSGEVIKRVGPVLDARSSGEADRLWREHLDELWATNDEAPPSSVDYRCIPLGSVEPVYFAEPERRVRGGQR